MPAGTKTFSTQFQIGAKFTGQQAFSQANKALDRTQRNAKQTHVSFTKMFGAVAGGLAAFELGRRAIAGLNAALFSSIEAALDVQKAHEGLRSAVERNFDRWKHGSKTIDEVTKSLIGLAEANEKTGFDAENAEAGFAKLQDSMAPERIKLFSQTFFDITAKLKGANASGEDFAEVAQLINSAVNQGRPGLLRQVGLTKEQVKAFATLKTVEERRAYIAKFVGQKVAGEQARVFKTTSGKIAQMQTQLGNLAESFGKPLVEPMGAMADAFREVFIAMGPVADEFADRLGPEVQKFSQWLIDNKAEITAWAKWAADWALWLGQKFAVSIQDTYAQMQATWEKIKEIWGAMSTWFDENVIKKIAALWDWLIGNSYLVEGAAAGWEKIKAIWGTMAKWFDDNVIKPIWALWDWLINKLSSMWENWNKAVATGQLPTPYSGGARQEGDYRAPWQPSGEGGGGAAATQAVAAQEGSGSAAARAATEAAGPLAQMPATNEAVASERARVMAQLQEPGMRELVAATISHEQGSAEGRADVLESLVNRAVVTGKHPRSLIEGGGRKGSFYGPYRRGEVQATLAKGVSPGLLKEYDAAQAAVAAGRNRIKGMIDQGMINEIKGEKINVGGEYYGMMGYKGERQTAAYRAGTQATKMVKGPAEANTIPGGVQYQGKGITPATPQNYTPIQPSASVPVGSSLKDVIKDMSLKQRMGGATGGQSIAMNAPITVNGVSAGRESLMAKKTALALRDPAQQLLTEIKKARAQESRLGYV